MPQQHQLALRSVLPAQQPQLLTEHINFTEWLEVSPTTSAGDQLGAVDQGKSLFSLKADRSQVVALQDVPE